MDDETAEEPAESVSNALLDALSDVYATWMATGGDYGVAWDILTDDAYTDDFTAHDWATLFDIGDAHIQTGPEMSPEMAAEFDSAPEFFTAIVGLQSLMVDRFNREHPETLEEMEANIARLNAEADGLNAQADRLERGKGGQFSRWTTRLWRRKQIAPGVRVNLSKSGLSLTLGPKGAHTTFGPRGPHSRLAFRERALTFNAGSQSIPVRVVLPLAPVGPSRLDVLDVIATAGPERGPGVIRAR